MQKVHNVHPSGFVTFKSIERRLLSAINLLPHVPSSNVVSQGFVEIVAVVVLPVFQGNSVSIVFNSMSSVAVGVELAAVDW